MPHVLVACQGVLQVLRRACFATPYFDTARGFQLLCSSAMTCYDGLCLRHWLLCHKQAAIGLIVRKRLCSILTSNRNAHVAVDSDRVDDLARDGLVPGGH